MSDNAPAFLEVTNVKRWFDDVHAVDGITFRIETGQVVGLIGANGAGKTTTMRILATLDVPDAGMIRMTGVDIVQHPNAVRRRIGWMPDYFTPYKETTVADYLDFFARAHGLRDQELERRVAEAAEFTDLVKLSNRPTDKLSKGEVQRLCLARTLLNDPEFLILDEPAAGLDPKARLEFKNLVRVLRDRGKTMLISSHILSELGEMCDTLLFMDRGRVMHHGNTELLRRGNAAAAVSVMTLVIEGPVQPLLDWLAVRPGWKVVEELRDGVRAEFTGGDPTTIASELRRLVKDDINLVDFHRDERRLEEAFVDMLRDVKP